MADLILLTGGTGTLGRKVLQQLLTSQHRVRVLSRTLHVETTGSGSGARDSRLHYVVGDLRRDDGLDSALAGVKTIIHLAGGPTGDDLTTARLVRTAEACGVEHLILMSVVGADRLPVRTRTDRTMFGYFAAKHRAEDVVASSTLGWSILRSTQFHESLLRLTAGLVRSPIVPVFAGFRFQPIAAEEVALRLVELADSEPAGLVPELAGPQTHSMQNLVRTYLELSGQRRPIIGLPIPGPAAHAYRAGANLSLNRAVGQLTWTEFLTSHLGEHSV